jgi:hypothetical protein
MGKYRLYSLKSVNRNVGNDYDYVAERVVARFDLSKKLRVPELKDKVHFLLLFWKKNKRKFKKYKTKSAIGRLLELDHASVIHYAGTDLKFEGRRKKSNFFNENNKELASYIWDLCCPEMKERNEWFINSVKQKDGTSSDISDLHD